MPLTQTFALKPSYERKLAGGWLLAAVFVMAIVIGEAVIYWGLSSGRNPPEYFGTAIGFLFVLPLVAYLFIRLVMKGKKKLATFIDSTSNMIKSWACIGPLLDYIGYEAVCELSNGCYVQCLFGATSDHDSKGGILRVFRFIEGPETVKAGPLIKARIDGRTLEKTKLPSTDEAFNEWRGSETLWKKLVSTDEFIRSWVTTHSAWKSFRLKQPMLGDVFHVSVLCHDLYLRSPTCEGEWLKGKTLGIALQFIEPTGQQEMKDFYNSTITIADKIIQHVKETM